MWRGSAAVCMNDGNQVLMVLQGKPEEEKRWALPAGGVEAGEAFEDCCVREVWEETGYQVVVGRPLFVKNGVTYGMDVEVHYFQVELIGGSAVIQDPDGLIHEIAWKNHDEIRTLNLSFPEDRDFLLAITNIHMDASGAR